MRLPTAKGPLRLHSRSVALGLRCSSVGAFVCRPACESGSSRGGGGHLSGDVQAGFCLVSSGPHPACPSDATFSTWSCRSPGMWLRVGASPPGAVRAQGPDVSSSGGSWVLAQERVSVHHLWVFPGAIRDTVRSKRGAAGLWCGRELVGCAGSQPPALPAWGHGASLLPCRVGFRTEGMTRVLACPCFAPLRHISSAWRAVCVMLSLPPPFFCQTLHQSACSPACSPQMVMLPRGCWGALDVPGGVHQATAPSSKGLGGPEHVPVVRLMLQDSTGHQLGVEETSCVALAVPQFPLVHHAGCKRVRAGHARVAAGQSRSHGVCRVRRRSRLAGSGTQGDLWGHEASAQLCAQRWCLWDGQLPR